MTTTIISEEKAIFNVLALARPHVSGARHLTPLTGYASPAQAPIDWLQKVTKQELSAILDWPWAQPTTRPRMCSPHTFTVLKHLDQWGLTNHVLVITRWRVDPEDCAVLNSFSNIRLTVLVTHSGIDDDRIEPVDSHIAATGLRTLHT
ncbi:MAG: hypothetical protein ACREXY_08255, partial [Gammaproteobacteria bacterium]